MDSPAPDTRRIGVRYVLRETAALVNGSGPLEAILAAVTERVMLATHASEVVVATGGRGAWRVRWRRDHQGFHTCDEPVADPVARAVLARGVPHNDQGRIYAGLHDDGRIIGALWVTSESGTYDEDSLALCDAFAGYLSLALQKAALHEHARQLEALIVVDPLTGVPNRRAFDAALEREWARALRNKRPTSVALVDVDHFKLFNDAFGHPQGDACLKQIAQACQESVVRSTDCFARYGGEEFGLVMVDAGPRIAAGVAERLRHAVEALRIPHEGSPSGYVTVSVGVASAIPTRPTAAQELVERADRALYRAKGTGRDRVVVVDVAADDEPPAERVAKPAPPTLPAPASTLIGRDEDVARIGDLLEAYRIVTLTGAGGVGKTRLALEAARRRAGHDADGVFFVELASLTDDANVVAAFAARFGVEEHAGRSTLTMLVAALRDREVLLVVDNCEQVVAQVAQTVATIVREAPNVRVLTTSREPLGILGEATYRVPPLSTPPAGVPLHARDAKAYSAVTLFVERARAAEPSFTITDANASTIGEICRRLDGIALAIELAAARVRVWDVARIAELLDSRFRLLGSANRSALPHQQTLRATIDWSYDLLGAVERRLFSRLAVFHGGFTIEAIVATCTDGELTEDNVFASLSALVDKSLVVFEAPRYRLLESMREYASERLDATGVRDVVARRHATYYRGLVERVSLDEGQGSYRRWVAPLVAELDNLRAALEWSLGAGNDVHTGAAICAALVETSSLGRWSEWAAWNTRALEALAGAVPPAPLVRGRLLTRRAELASRYGAFGDSAAREAAREAQALLRKAPQTKWRLEALNAYADALIQADANDEALEVARAGLDVARDAHDAVYQASFLRRLGSLLADWNPAEATSMYEESIALCRQIENDFGLALSYHGMSYVHFAQGRLDDAIAAVRIACSVRRDMGDSRGLLYALVDVAQFSLARGQTDGVGEALREALELVGTMDSILGLALVVQATAALALATGSPETAARLTGYADAAYASLGVARSAPAERLRTLLAANLDGVLAGEHLEMLLARGARATPAAAQAEASALLDAVS